MAQYENYRGQGQQAGGYSQSTPYGGNPSAYGQAGSRYDEDTSYGGGNVYAQGQYDQGNYEMSNMNASDPNRILTECRQVSDEADGLDQRQERLQQLQRIYLDDTGPTAQGGSSEAVTNYAEDLLERYQGLVARMKIIKQNKESGNPRNAAQVGRVDRRVKQSLNKFQQLDTEYRRRLQDRMERDYRIVRPDASDAEVREAVQDPNQQIFSQALISSDRRGVAQSTAERVRGRHEAIQKIEREMTQLAAMFQDLDALVVQQDAQVTQIDQRGEEVREDVTKANVELDGAVTKARAARKKKWICLGIAVLIVIIIVVVVAVAVTVTRN